MDSQDGSAALTPATGIAPAAGTIDSIGDGDVVSELGSNGTLSDSAVGGGYIPYHLESSATFGGGKDHVDSIILVYDLGRIETFDRLESHWLPLIDWRYNSKVSQIICYTFGITVIFSRG